MVRVAYEATALLGRRTGVGEFCLNLAQALNFRSDVDLIPFAVSWRGRNRLSEFMGGIRVPPSKAMPARPLHELWSRWNFPALDNFTEAFEVVHGTNFVVPPTRAGARVVTVHDLTPLKFPHIAAPATLEFPKLIQKAISDGAFVHTPSQFVADEVLENFEVSQERVVAIHHGAPVLHQGLLDDLDHLDNDLVRKINTRPFILGLGTVEPRKDFSTLLRGYEAIASEYPDLLLVVAGGSGWGSDGFMRAVDESRFRNRIILTGYVDDLTRYYLLRNSQVFVYSSVYEGFGLPPIEAMALETPVISTRAGSLPEVLGEGALYFEVGDVDGLASRITNVFEDTNRLSKLLLQGKNQADRYTWDKSAASMLDLYKRAIRSRPKQR
ncbi:MAG: glycosyltransferase family 1 protein [Actinomycetota bacterium]|nr:glycosyltransferase family 1 protein [Actinomycetota bacterium]